MQGISQGLSAGISFADPGTAASASLMCYSVHAPFTSWCTSNRELAITKNATNCNWQIKVICQRSAAQHGVLPCFCLATASEERCLHSTSCLGLHPLPQLLWQFCEGQVLEVVVHPACTLPQRSAHQSCSTALPKAFCSILAACAAVPAGILRPSCARHEVYTTCAVI